MMKIALGTVQWGLNYGISNLNGIPSDRELMAILALAKKNNITLYDTASQYGSAEERLGEHLDVDCDVITKLNYVDPNTSIEQELNRSLQKLKRKQIYGYLFHNSNSLLGSDHLWLQMNKLKEKELVRKIGYSIYYPNELLKLLEKKFIPDIIQLPYSILDRKFEPYFDYLKSLGIEIHVRSVFLQGLYFLNPKKLPARLSELYNVLSYIKKLSESNGVSISRMCLDFVKQNEKVDFAIIGVENTSQLNETIRREKHNLEWTKINKFIENIEINKELLNPTKW